MRKRGRESESEVQSGREGELERVRENIERESESER